MRQTGRLLTWYIVSLFLSTFFSGVFGIANSVTIKTINMVTSDLLNNHRVHVKSLNLGSGSDYYELAVKGLESFNISDGLLVGREGTKSDGGWNVAIGGGSKNEVKGNSVGIVGGLSNKIKGANSNSAVIGGGRNNEVKWENAVVGGGYYNQIYDGAGLSDVGGMILGGYHNRVRDVGFILGGNRNAVDGKNAFALGNGASAIESSFSWNDGQSQGLFNKKSANIWASSGILIGTYDTLPGVNLVVNGAVKIGDSSTSGVGGEVKMVNGCLYAYDGNHWHVLGKNSELAGNCNTINTGDVCKFGKVELQAGDRVTAYSKPYAVNCNLNTIKQTVTCSGGILLTNGGGTNYIYPSCYRIEATPTL